MGHYDEAYELDEARQAHLRQKQIDEVRDPLRQHLASAAHAALRFTHKGEATRQVRLKIQEALMWLEEIR